MKIAGFGALFLLVGLAINLPLILLGVSRETLLVVDLVIAAVWALLPSDERGDSAERLLSSLFEYGIIFTMWAVIGLIAIVILGLLSTGIHPPYSFYIIAAFGVVGVVRAMMKSG